MNDEVLSEQGALFFGGDTREYRMSNIECRSKRKKIERINADLVLIFTFNSKQGEEKNIFWWRKTPLNQTIIM